MFLPPLDSSLVALQYETGTKFSHGAVPKLFSIKNHRISALPRVVSRKVCQEMDGLMLNCRTGESSISKAS